MITRKINKQYYSQLHYDKRSTTGYRTRVYVVYVVLPL